MMPGTKVFIKNRIHSVAKRIPNGSLKNDHYYWIRRYTESGNRSKLQIARFERHSPGFSRYLGKWHVFGRKTPVMHTDDVKVLEEIRKPPTLVQ